MTDTTTIFLVDDHKMVRAGLRAFFASQADLIVVGEAGSGAEAVEKVTELAPDVVLMDLVMPEMDGVEATRRIREVSPRSQVLVLTSHHEDAHIFPAIRAGALSYLLKNIDPDELADAIRLARQGEAVLHPRVAARLVQEVRSSSAETNPFTALTDREMEVLLLIAEAKSNAEIADDLTITERTVKGHITNILSKLHLSDRTQAAVYAWRKGIIRDE